MTKKKKTIIIFALVLLVLIVIAGIILAVTPAEGCVTVWYRAGDIVVPITVENVSRIEHYYLYEELYQVVVWQYDALVPVVFTPFDYVSHRKALFSDIPIVEVHNNVYHTYDNVLQGVKYGLRKNFVQEKYEEYFGRPPTEQELYIEMDKLIQKVQLEQLDVRLQHYPESVCYRLGVLCGRPANAFENAVIKLLLRCGMDPNRIIGLLV